MFFEAGKRRGGEKWINREIELRDRGATEPRVPLEEEEEEKEILCACRHNKRTHTHKLAVVMTERLLGEADDSSDAIIHSLNWKCYNYLDEFSKKSLPFFFL